MLTQNNDGVELRLGGAGENGQVLTDDVWAYKVLKPTSAQGTLEYQKKVFESLHEDGLAVEKPRIETIMLNGEPEPCLVTPWLSGGEPSREEMLQTVEDMYKLGYVMLDVIPENFGKHVDGKIYPIDVDKVVKFRLSPEGYPTEPFEPLSEELEGAMKMDWPMTLHILKPQEDESPVLHRNYVLTATNLQPRNGYDNSFDALIADIQDDWQIEEVSEGSDDDSLNSDEDPIVTMSKEVYRHVDIDFTIDLDDERNVEARFFEAFTQRLGLSEWDEIRTPGHANDLEDLVKLAIERETDYLNLREREAEAEDVFYDRASESVLGEERDKAREYLERWVGNGKIDRFVDALESVKRAQTFEGRRTVYRSARSWQGTDEKSMMQSLERRFVGELSAYDLMFALNVPFNAGGNDSFRTGSSALSTTPDPKVAVGYLKNEAGFYTEKDKCDIIVMFDIVANNGGAPVFVQNHEYNLTLPQESIVPGSVKFMSAKEALSRREKNLPDLVQESHDAVLRDMLESNKENPRINLFEMAHANKLDERGGTPDAARGWEI